MTINGPSNRNILLTDILDGSRQLKPLSSGEPAKLLRVHFQWCEARADHVTPDGNTSDWWKTEGGNLLKLPYEC